MNSIYVPATDLSDWQKLLAEPDRQWKKGFSAMRLAEAWQAANGFPSAIASVLRSAGASFPSLAPLLILPEHRVALNGGSRPSQSDLWILASHDSGLASITVEGKVSESFGPTISEWLVGASPGKQERLAFLTHILGLPAAPTAEIRYQLLHRVASAILEAERFKATMALCLVHSFSETNEGFADFAAFCGLFGRPVQPGQVVALGQRKDVPFYAAWAQNS